MLAVEPLRLMFGPVLLVLVAWGVAALWIDGPRSRAVATILAVALVGATAASLSMVESAGLALGLSTAPFATVLLWWLSLRPSNDRDWPPDVAHTPRAEVHGDLVTIRDYRNFAWRSEEDFTERWEERTFDLSRLEGWDVYLCYWGPRRITHTIASFVFADGRHLAISIEARRPVGQPYSALRSLFRRFELCYVVGDERDLIRLRTNVRTQRVYLYRLTTPIDQTRTLLLRYLNDINRLADTPRWYNALTTNCTTTIRHLNLSVGDADPWDWRILVNGYLDELGYDRGSIDTSMPFAELRERSDVTDRARAATAETFSAAIRDGLPDPRRSIVTMRGAGPR